VDPEPPVAMADEVKPSPADPPAPQRPWPATRRQDVVDTVHGQKIADPFRWLEDEKSPEVQQWMKAQDDFARAQLGKLPGRTELVDRLKQLYYFDAISAPLHRKGRFFFTR
jgi:prolyl oligopeptidase